MSVPTLLTTRPSRINQKFCLLHFGDTMYKIVPFDECVFYDDDDQSFKNECKKALKSILNVTSEYVFDNSISSKENLPPLSQQAQESQIKIRKQRRTKKGDPTNAGDKNSKQSQGLQVIFGK
ncbi:unnamed protein product [Didymodactylos carnosus]|uniref:Uncharacterized protein n=1 Tax=Didymodactylos carnosus TaxID=1234261 RepID=A0A815XGV0_9BILA|nr:unnamed protein product [Didymodactylos carnosus]CAF4418618.1 unnamed protein product [Didymodactylos carnosus]